MTTHRLARSRPDFRAMVEGHRYTRQTIEVRSTDDKTRTAVLRAMVYNVVDDYDTRFRPGVFADSLAKLRDLPPVLAWGHDWLDPIGHMVDFEDKPDCLDTVQQFDDFGDVPQARRAYSQIKSGTIRQCSVGFYPRGNDEPPEDAEGVSPYTIDYTRADLDEVSLVLRGAVPGADVIAVRRRAEPTIDSIPVRDAVRVMQQLQAGEISLAEAQRMVAGMPVRGQRVVTQPTEPTTGETDTDEPDGDDGEAERTARLAEMDARMRTALRGRHPR